MLTREMIRAVLDAIDSKLATSDPLSLEELEVVQHLVQAKLALEAMRP